MHPPCPADPPLLCCPHSPDPLKQRKLLYTAVTRAKGLLILMATRRALADAAANLPLPRNNSLGARMQELQQKKNNTGKSNAINGENEPYIIEYGNEAIEAP